MTTGDSVAGVPGSICCRSTCAVIPIGRSASARNGAKSRARSAPSGAPIRGSHRWLSTTRAAIARHVLQHRQHAARQKPLGGGARRRHDGLDRRRHRGGCAAPHGCAARRGRPAARSRRRCRPRAVRARSGGSAATARAAARAPASSAPARAGTRASAARAAAAPGRPPGRPGPARRGRRTSRKSGRQPRAAGPGSRRCGANRIAPQGSASRRNARSLGVDASSRRARRWRRRAPSRLSEPRRGCSRPLRRRGRRRTGARRRGRRSPSPAAGRRSAPPLSASWITGSRPLMKSAKRPAIRSQASVAAALDRIGAELHQRGAGGIGSVLTGTTVASAARDRSAARPRGRTPPAPAGRGGGRSARATPGVEAGISVCRAGTAGLDATSSARQARQRRRPPRRCGRQAPAPRRSTAARRCRSADRRVRRPASRPAVSLAASSLRGKSPPRRRLLDLGRRDQVLLAQALARRAPAPCCPRSARRRPRRRPR